METLEMTIWNGSKLAASELARNIIGDIKHAYAKGLTQDSAARIVTGTPVAFRVQVTVEKQADHEPENGSVGASINDRDELVAACQETHRFLEALAMGLARKGIRLDDIPEIQPYEGFGAKVILAIQKGTR